MIDWDRIVREDGPAVWRTAQRLLVNRADADECFQETFAAALQYVQRSAQPVGNWRAMLVRLATARAVDRLRQRVSRSSRESGESVAGVLDHRLSSRPAERAEQSEMSERLRQALTHLPPKQADAFCLHCLEGWSYRDVAEQMSESVENIGVLIHRARAALRQQIGSILPEAATGAESDKVSR
jgi:RNA polymerase sigma-70 factor (ECF subfamily)